MRKRLALCSLFGILLLAAGCGGNDSGGMPSLPPATGGSGGGATFDASTVTATVSGNIMFEGTPPQAARLQMAADPFCQSRSSGATSQEVLVTEDSKLQNVILYVRSGHNEGARYAVPSEPVIIDQENCIYHPHVFTMMANQELRITNSDSTLHNIHAFAEVNEAFNIGQPVQGMETVKTFDQPEMPLPIRCDVHRWMGAYVGVFDHPFHTTSGDTGTYELKLPAGSYEIVAWHEKYGEQVGTIEVSDGGTAELNFTFSEGMTD